MWYDKDRVEAELDIELMPLKRGGALGYNSRLIIHRNGISFDNHSWFLSLPDEFFLDEDYAPERSMIVPQQKLLRDQRTDFITLEEGKFPAGKSWDGAQHQQIQIPELSDILEEQRRTQESVARWWRNKRPRHTDDITDIEEDEGMESEGETHSMHTSFEDMSWEELGNTAWEEESIFTSQVTQEDKTMYDYHLSVVVEPDIPMKTIYRVMYTAHSESFVSMLAGWQDDRLQGVLSKPVIAYKKPPANLYPSVHPLHCSAFLSPTKGWVSCGHAPPISTNKDCSDPDWERIMKDLSILNTRCVPHWNKQNRHHYGRAELEETGIEIFLVVTGDLSFRELVHQMETAHDAYPAVHQQNYPHWSGINDITPHAGCAYSLDVRNLREEQLEAICNRKDEHEIDRVFPDYTKLMNTIPEDQQP